MKLCNLASFDPAVTSRGRVGLKGASQLDREVWNAFQADWETLGTESERRFIALMGTAPATEDEECWMLREGPTEMETTTRRRLGQDFFRRTVLVSYHHRCCTALLSASRGVPSDRHHAPVACELGEDRSKRVVGQRVACVMESRCDNRSISVVVGRLDL